VNNLVVFSSGGGSNFRAIFSSTLNNTIEDSKIDLLVSNNPDCNAIKFAKDRGIDTFIINSKRYPSKKKYNTALKNKLIDYNPSLIVLARYMKLIPKEIVNIFKSKIINIHPAKLPEFGGKGFYGMNIHKAVIDSGANSTAVTIHYVNEEYDKGMIISEKIINVMNNDTPELLSKRVLKHEHELYSKTINQLLKENGRNE